MGLWWCLHPVVPTGIPQTSGPECANCGPCTAWDACLGTIGPALRPQGKGCLGKKCCQVLIYALCRQRGGLGGYGLSLWNWLNLLLFRKPAKCQISVLGRKGGWEPDLPPSIHAGREVDIWTDPAFLLALFEASGALWPPSSPHTPLLQPSGHAGFCALPLTPVPGPLPVLFPLRGALPLYTLTYPTSSASQMLSSLEGPPPSHAHTIDPSPAPPAHCFPLPSSSVLPVGLIIHWFYFFLFMYVSLSEWNLQALMFSASRTMPGT